MNDTDPQIAELVRSRLLERSGAERILMGSRMFDVAKTIMLASFPEGLTEIEIKARLCERLYGDEVDVSAFLQHPCNPTQALNESRRIDKPRIKI